MHAHQAHVLLRGTICTMCTPSNNYNSIYSYNNFYNQYTYIRFYKSMHLIHTYNLHNILYTFMHILYTQLLWLWSYCNSRFFVLLNSRADDPSLVASITVKTVIIASLKTIIGLQLIVINGCMIVRNVT